MSEEKENESKKGFLQPLADIAPTDKVVSLLDKFTDIAKEMVGKAFSPRLRKDHANSSAYEITSVSEAMAKVAPEITVKYKSVKDDKEIILDKEATKDLLVNTFTANIEQEVKRQINKENILNTTYAILASETDSISNEKVDQDWLTRFKNIAQDVSNEDMQKLWSQILAGEIKKPSTYSLRTMETLKNMSQKDAETFKKFAKYALFTRDGACIIDIMDGEKNLNCDISMIESLHLKDLGLFSSDMLSFGPNSFSFKNKEYIDLNLFYDKNKILKIKNLSSQISVIKFTSVGYELLNLIDESCSFDYLIEVTKVIFNDQFNDKNKLEISTGEHYPDRAEFINSIDLIKEMKKASVTT